MKLASIAPELRAEWIGEFERIGVAALHTSLELNTLSYSADKLLLAREWLASKREAQSQESLSIARKDSSLAERADRRAARANIIAIVAVIISAIPVIKSIFSLIVTRASLHSSLLHLFSP